MSTLAKDFARGCGRSLVIRVIATVIGLPLACIIIFVPIWLLFRFDFQPWTLVVAALFWLVPMFVGVVVFPFGVVLRRKAKLDALFLPLGLTGKAYQTSFRQYHGNVGGRHVDVYFYRGPVLEIEVNSTLQTRLGVTDQHSDSQFLASLVGQQPLSSDGPALNDLTVFSADEVWAQSLLAVPEVVDTLRRLTTLGNGIFTRQQVILRPGTFKLMLTGNRRLFKMDLSLPQVQAWLDDLLNLVQTAETLPSPQMMVELTAAEKLALKIRQRNPYLALWVGLGLVLFFLIAAVVIFSAVFIFASMTGGL